MTTTAAATRTPAAARRTADRTTRALLGALAVAGPLWAAVSLTQAATRDGFDLTRHPLSLLSTGALGWLQITNFVLAGILLVTGATGLRRAIPSRWAPRLVRITGLGMFAAGVLVMDPADGYPIGTPAGMPATMSWHSIGHMVAGSITFTALIAACYVLARHFKAAGARGTALAATLSGTALLLGDAWAMTGGPAGSLTLAAGAITAMCFLTATALHVRR
ncbi:hypothetical protein GCM10010168_64970 [Actinoplanes ianthinogenes]|uniref:DUF998 domain-containing protein n=1 Tax=Actinoplanes ianthinogenes TaxID=122358 RepID=A0ABN6C9K9_9ACTN|nr:DUF998 domain-containing protein [Actinoplanes ianthinogenes]BCJ42125.1 hypothetical protein Aiant_27820 [Actinoplanes ianthinogenes]GGR37531.1 hypothetical protein GCM10010168_64970 [Actinoplanes ianthinogenes]